VLKQTIDDLEEKGLWSEIGMNPPSPDTASKILTKYAKLCPAKARARPRAARSRATAFTRC